MSIAVKSPIELSDKISRSAKYRPELDVERLALIASLYFSAFCNGAFWNTSAAYGAFRGPGGQMLAICLFVAMTALSMLLLCTLMYRSTAKPVLTVLLLATAMAVHYMTRYTVYLDADMIRNILHTDTKESAELITFGLFKTMFLFGAIPIALLWRIRLTARPFKLALAVRAAWMVSSVLVACIAILLSFQNLSALMRNHKDVRFLITPGNYLVSLASVALAGHRGQDQPRLVIGGDASIAGRAAEAKPRLLVIVVGETVRAQNWGLNGYARQTTPRLQRIAPINFSDVQACGTSTEVSVPCMFSPYGRASYDKDLIERSESLLHVLEHAGVGTLWRDNQTGCKGVCEGLSYESFEHDHDARFCNGDGCMDEVMLRGLVDEASQRPGDVVVVLHQLGNHGPNYYKRYPSRLRRFLPTCESSELGLCTQAEIVNSYDNAILNTDEFLAHTIQLLSSQNLRDTGLIYVSDHGESLGENGLYLHGIPYAIAPDTQKKVPMIIWLSPGMLHARGIDLACMKQQARLPTSHDNLFHSVLGLMQVKTAAYDRKRDLFATCSPRYG